MTQNFYPGEPLAVNARKGSRKRKPGGQPGNQNARKHGFYSQAITPELEALMLPAKELEGIDLELALARAKALSIGAHTPQNYAVLFDALAIVGRLNAVKERLGRHTSRRFSRALKIVLDDLASLGSKPNRRKSRKNGEVVSPPFPENDSCVI